MPYRHEYFPSDALKLINQSEGQLVRDRKRTTPAAAGVHGDYAAHAVGRHLLKGAPGALGSGAPESQVKDRFLNNPTNPDGSSRFSSAWLGKGDMAVLLCETLNSAIGQEALGALDRGVSRVMIHYLNEGKLKQLFGSLGDLMLKYSQVAVVAAHDIMVSKTFNTSKGPLTKDVRQHIPESRSASITAADIAAVNAVLDRFQGGLHLQTLFPSHEATPSYAEWRVGGVNVKAAIAPNGAAVYRTSPGTA